MWYLVTYNDFVIKAKEVIEYNTLLWQQTHIMFIPITNKVIQENLVEEEKRVRYDFEELWYDFVFKENKVLFFIDKYLNSFLDGLSICDISKNMKNISMSSNETIEKAIYYFDSFISFFYTLIEPQQKVVFCDFFGSKKVNSFFPSRNEIGLFWKIYMLRNRIIHFTNAKYNENKKECIRYQNFSSNVKVISIDSDGKIKANCTLIDINKCEQARTAIRIAIKNRNMNPFDILFPNESAKGYGKKKPFMCVIRGDICFNHIDSGIEIIKDIHNVFNNLNKLFLEKFMFEDPNKEKTLNSRTQILFNDKKIVYSLSEVFCEKNRKF